MSFYSVGYDLILLVTTSYFFSIHMKALFYIVYDVIRIKKIMIRQHEYEGKNKFICEKKV